MDKSINQQFPHSWEEAIAILRNEPQQQQLIFDAYLTSDLVDNCVRFAASAEFNETLCLISKHCLHAKDLLDIPGGNGIATHAFAATGFNVTVVEPNSSSLVGRGAIRQVLVAASLDATIVEAFGENLPFPDSSFDIVYVRQGLHHAHDLRRMLCEYFRVLRSSGILLACREHVVEDHRDSLNAFLSTQVDHQLYGGENAFTLNEYKEAIQEAGFKLREEIPPYDSQINLYPNTPETLAQKIISSLPGKILASFLPKAWVIRIGMWRLRRSCIPGRLYSFVAMKP